MKSMISLVLGFLSVSALAANQPLTIKLWPDGAPEPAGFQAKPESFDERNDGVVRLANVSDPTITVYRPAIPNGTAVLVCPGGGFKILSIENEGSRVCEWLNTLGVTGILLKYRVPVRDEADPGREPLQDAQRAMGIIRQRAAEWRINPIRIGILGFSAGGHVSVMTALQPNERTYPRDPALEAEDATPNFAVPIYTAWIVDPKNPGQLRPEIKVTANSPPMCLVHSHTDKSVTTSAGSALLYLEYKKLELPAELHIYTKGGHGFGMRKQGLPSDGWPARVREWMESMGLLK